MPSDAIPKPFRLAPPAPSALIDWPASLGQRFTLTVDTEEEFDWQAPLSREGHATSAIAALPEAHRRLREAGAELAYMVDWPVASSDAAAAILRDLADGQGAMIGTQLHPWVNPPFDEPLSAANSFPGNLPASLEAAKLDRLTDLITDRLGRRPTAYRAGRYGIGPATFDLLAARGYRLDSSVRARYDYSGGHGPDFGAVGSHAFRVGPGGSIVELPLTTVFTGRLRRGGASLDRWLGRVPHGRGAFARSGLLARVALTPEDMPVEDALEAVRVALGEGVAILNFSFHSPSLVPGHTPYVRDAADLAAFYGWWNRVLGLLAARGARAISLDAVVAAADAALASPRAPA
ncbi:MAG: polysaccharide deacetylase family protein [Sphingomonas sp.]